MSASPTYSCLLVDDEPIALEILANYTGRLPFLSVSERFQSALQAYSFLQRQTVDLLFIDINMPELSGLQLLRSLSSRPRVVITTAYREFACEGFDLEVADYLVKPIAYERFLRAVSRALPLSSAPVKPAETSPGQYLFIKQDRKFVKVYYGEICFIESDRDFVSIHTASARIFTRERISHFEELLPATDFVRVHRRFIIAVRAIQFIREDEVYLAAGNAIPIGKTYRDAVTSRLNLR